MYRFSVQQKNEKIFLAAFSFRLYIASYFQKSTYQFYFTQILAEYFPTIKIILRFFSLRSLSSFNYIYTKLKPSGEWAAQNSMVFGYINRPLNPSQKTKHRDNYQQQQKRKKEREGGGREKACFLVDFTEQKESTQK